MSSISPSQLFASAFDNKKLFILMVVLVVTLFIDTEIGDISDMIPKQISFNGGISAFVGIWVIFVMTQYYTLAYLKKIIKRAELKRDMQFNA